MRITLIYLSYYLQLKVYASTQQTRSHWTAADFIYQGYYHSCESDWTLVSVLFGTSILIVALTTIALLRAAPKDYQKVTLFVERGNQWYSFFWAACFVALVCSTILLLCELLVPSLMYLYSGQYQSPVNACSNEAYLVLFPITHYMKMVMMFLLIVIDILVACCIIPKNADFPIPTIAYILSFQLCCTCCCCLCCCCTCCRRSNHLRSKWIQAIALTILFIFAQFIALSALPTILRIFVLPIQTLAVVAFFAAAIFCVTAFIALLLRSIGQLTCRGRCRDNCSTLQPLLILMLILFLAIVILTSYVYIKLITSGVKGNRVSIGGFIISFLPSALLTILGWFVTKSKFMEQMLPQERDSSRNRSRLQVDHATEQTPLNASINV